MLDGTGVKVCGGGRLLAMNDPDGSLGWLQPWLVLDGLERPVVHRLEGCLVVRGDRRGRHRYHWGGVLEDGHRGRLGQDWSLVHHRVCQLFVPLP